ncbi:MAG: transporter substrate-binding domain-containing protein [Cetobacterium sp.]|uniref:transporter substrate-binding domain-containing protein n=1 Tax=unclassified Cetobacterium TaxID=2630983 RepID=UPI00163BE718|nr:transporter substrate-binding domain-containing protein [Cetobacterium sp. 2A]MBC2856132.1 transporter substrate-binding domain-containing protein [Cetobacterium sp. 2A]
MKKIIAILLSFFLFSFAMSEEQPLVVGMELSYPPFETTDIDGNPTGFSVDLAEELGKYLNRPVKIENMSYSGLIPSLISKKIDIILSSMTITDEREKAINFSVPYAKSYLTLLVSNKSGIQKPIDLNTKGKKIAVRGGTTAHLVAREYFPNAEVLVFDKETTAVLEVSQGKVDAFVYDPLSIYRNWQNYKSTTTPLFDQFQPRIEYWGIGYRKQDKELGKKIDEFITNFKADGGLDRLADKYLSEEKKAFEEQGIPFFIN